MLPSTKYTYVHLILGAILANGNIKVENIYNIDEVVPMSIYHYLRNGVPLIAQSNLHAVWFILVLGPQDICTWFSAVNVAIS
jgi:hypothetical protein